MKPRGLSPRQIRAQVIDIAKTGKSRQAIFDQIAPRFKGRERDLAVIIASVFLPKDKKDYGWCYPALIGMVITTIIATIIYAFVFPVNFAVIGLGIVPLIVANGIALQSLLTYQRGIVDRFYAWSLGAFFLGMFLVGGEGMEIPMLGLAIWAILGFILGRFISKRLWGNFRHSAHCIINAKGQTVAISKIRFSN